MKNIINNLKIRNKLLLILLLPMVGLLFLSALVIQEKTIIYNQMGHLGRMVGLATTSSALIHELQKERGMTAGYLGSKGTKFNKELGEQYGVTDKKIRSFKDALRSSDLSIYSASAVQKLSAARVQLQDIEEIRSSSRSLQIKLKAALGYYTAINTTLINSTDQMVAVANDASLVRQLSAYSNFLKSKERAGIERAVLANTFSKDKFGPDMYKYFITLVAEQNAFLTAFRAEADSEAVRFFDRSIDHGYFRETAKMRGVAYLKHMTGQFNIDPAFWFSQQTGKIEILKSVEDRLAGILITLAGEKQASARLALMLNVIALSVVAVLALLIGAAILKRIAGSIKKSITVAEEIASGNLNFELTCDEGEDELGRLMRTLSSMSKSLRDVVYQVRIGAENISREADAISASNASLSQRTEEQSSSLEETASTMEEMTSAIQQNSNHAKSAAMEAEENSKRAENGGSIISGAVYAMDEINEASTKISDIISTIDGIAFQTNLLALNAAVEAARAGESGRGFAVVASEVRILAQRSGDSAKEIRSLIENTLEKVENGTRIVNRSGEVLTEIVAGIQDVTSKVAEISHASEEQTTSVGQVNEVIIQLDTLTQQNSALVEETAAASHSLSEQSKMLVDTVSFFSFNDMMQPEKVVDVNKYKHSARREQGGAKRVALESVSVKQAI